MQHSLCRLVFLMVLFFILPGCDGESPLKELPSQVILESYAPNGELISKRILPMDDAVYLNLISFFEMQRVGWKVNVISYKTAPFILRANNTIIRCYQDLMVIDTVDSGSSKSVKKVVPGLLLKLSLRVE